MDMDIDMDMDMDMDRESKMGTRYNMESQIFAR